MTKLLEMLRKQDGRYSIGRVCTVITFCLWIFTWLYTLLLGKTYSHMEIVSIVCEVNFFVVLMSKTVDSRLISVKGDEHK